MNPTIPSPALVLVPEWLLIVIAAALIGTRGYLHMVVQHKRLQATDLLLICALIASTLSALFDVKLALLGLLDTNSENDPEPTLETVEYNQKLLYIGTFTYFTSFFFCRAALLVFYHQIFPIFMVKRRIALWLVTAYVAIAYVVSVLMYTTLCGDIRAYFSIDPDLIATCVPNIGIIMWTVTSNLNFSADLMLFCLPFLILHNVQMNKKLRRAVCGTFLLGLINLSVSLIRFLVIQVGAFSDGFNIPMMALITALELNTALIIACLPALRAYFADQRSASKRSSLKAPSPLVTIGGSGEKHQRAGVNKFGNRIPSLYHVDDDDLEAGRTSESAPSTASLSYSEPGIMIESSASRQ